MRLKHTSGWLQKQLLIADEMRLVALHIRRGDYVKLSRSFGLLATDYYLGALKELKERGHSWDEIWVFSDDVAEARKLLKPLENDFRFRYVEPPKGSNPLESLVLFGRAKFGIIANSTFSWWASWLSQNNKITIAPNNWFNYNSGNTFSPQGIKTSFFTYI
jgi:hypothetical protein